MKSLTTKMMIATAALMTVAGMASAQTMMEAKIPFAFRAGGTVFAAGTYTVDTKLGGSGATLMTIRDKNSNNRLLSYTFPGDVKASWKATGMGILSFQCGVSRCVLTDVWMGSALAYRLPAPGLGRDEPVRTAEIVMQPLKAE